MILGMESQMRISRNECFVYCEGQFSSGWEKERITDVGVTGLGETDQGVWRFQNTPVSPCHYALRSQQHAFGQTHHPNARLELGGVHSS